MFRKHIYPGFLNCERCLNELPRAEFLVDGDLPFVCRPCLTDTEVIDFIKSPLCKVMERLRPWEKVDIIRRIMKDREVLVRVKGSIHN